MEGLIVLLIIVVIGMLVFRWNNKHRKQKLEGFQLPGNAPEVLEEHVAFYQRLSATEKVEFRERIRDFLSRTEVTGVGGVEVDDVDRLLVASSAIIPIFHFKGWRYNNISEVLLYQGTFSKDFHTQGAGRNVLGMVGDGALHRQMILSKPALRQGFLAENDGNNTGIHEFVHLLDKADGATDGLPEYLLDKQHIAPWLREMHRQMQLIRQGDSDINPYASTNEAEFLAVAASYFFEKPELLQEHHPELYQLLCEMFKM